MAQTKESKGYWVVEFRFAYEVKLGDTTDPKKVAEKAQQEFSEQHGFVPDLWNARVFRFSSGEGTVGAQDEYFFSPTGTQHKELTKNYKIHQEKIDNESTDEEDFTPNEGEG